MASGTRSGGRDGSGGADPDSAVVDFSSRGQQMRLNTYCKMLGKLTDSNFFTWFERLRQLIYFANWDDDCLDVDQARPAWDGREEQDDEVCRNRRDACAVLRMCLDDGPMEHLLVATRPGDARGIYKKIHNRFCMLTHGATEALRNEINTYTQVNTGLTIEKFMSKLVEKQSLFFRITKNTSDPTAGSKLPGILMAGTLRPEFSGVCLMLSMQPVDTLTWEYVKKALLNFAIDHGLMNLSRKGRSLLMNNSKNNANTNKSTTPCRNFQKNGDCWRGDDCRFSHSATTSGTTSTSSKQRKQQNKEGGEGKKKPKFKKGTCYNCGDPSHMRPACPTLPKKGEKSGGGAEEEGGPPLVRNFMLSAIPAPQPRKATIGRDVMKGIALYSPSKQNSAPRVFDNAATEFMCPDMSYFIPGTVVTCSFIIGIGDGTSDMESHLKGDVYVQPENLPHFRLTEVLYVPKCPFFIFSWRKFDAKGCSALGYNGEWTINQLDRERRLVATIFTATLTTSDNLYHVNATIVLQGGESSLMVSQGEAITPPHSDGVVNSHKEAVSTTSNQGNSGAKAVRKLSDLSNVCNTAPGNLAPVPPLAEIWAKSSCIPKTLTVPVVKAFNLFLNDAQLHDQHVARGHLAKNSIRKEFGMPIVPITLDPPCDSCLRWNTTRPANKSKKKVNFDDESGKQVGVFEEWEIDIMHFSVPTWEGNFYVQVIVDVGSRRPFFSRFNLKSQSFHHFNVVYKKAKAEKRHKSLLLLTGGGEYDNKLFKEHEKQEGYKLNIKTAHFGKAWIAERMILTIRRAVMPTLDYAGASLNDWGFVVDHMEEVLADESTSVLPVGMSRRVAWELEKWPPNWVAKKKTNDKLLSLRPPWGCLMKVQVPRKNKMQPVVEDAMFLGSTSAKNNRNVVRLLRTGRVFATRAAEAHKESFPCKTKELDELTAIFRKESPSTGPPDLLGGENDVIDALSLPGINVASPAAYPSLDDMSMEAMTELHQALGITTRSPPAGETSRPTLRETREPSSKALENIANDASCLKLCSTAKIYPYVTPEKFDDAMTSPQKAEWILSIIEEIEYLISKKTFSVVLRPSHVQVHGSRYVFKIKYKMQPRHLIKNKTPAFIAERFKTRWVVQGFGLTQGRQYFNSYTSNLDYEADRIMTAIAVLFDLLMYILDFKNFYIEGNLKEAGEKEFYCELPKGYTPAEKGDWVALVHLGLYGWPPSGRVAQLRLEDKLVQPKGDFTRVPSSPMMFKYYNGDDYIAAGFYVDDGKFITNNEKELRKRISKLAGFGFTGELKAKPKKFLGVENHYYDDGSVKIYQEAHIIKFATKMGLEQSQPQPTPLDVNFENIPDNDKPLDSQGKKDYQSLVGDAIWLLRTRFDLAVSASVICTDMSSPTEHSLRLVKRFGRYVNGSPKRGLIYHRLRPGERCDTYAYVDSGLKGSYPRSGVSVFLGEPDEIKHINKSAAILAFTKKEKTAVVSTMHAEVLAMCRGVVACDWATSLRNDLNFPQSGPSIIFTDSKTAILFVTNTGRALTRETRHLRARVDYVMEAVRQGRVIFKWVPSHLNCADALTKALGHILFKRHVDNLMGHEPG